MRKITEIGIFVAFINVFANKVIDLIETICYIYSPVNDNRASLLRSSTTVRKPVNERDIYIHIWKNYVTFAFRVVPPVPNPIVRCASPDLSLR